MAANETMGECQLCGRTQKLTGKNHGVARHGFSLTGWGNTTGACRGSGYPAVGTGNVAAIDGLVWWHERNLDDCAKDLAEFAAPGYVWPEGVVPRLAIRNREDGIKNSKLVLEKLAARRAVVLARTAK